MNKLKAQLVWIPWFNGNPGKKPSLDGKRYAKWSDRSILMNYEQALALAKETPGLSGVGFVIPDGYVAIDLDDCIANNKINNQTSILINKFNSYTEKSPSGNGVHIIVECTKKLKKSTIWVEDQSVELITSGNFITFTGNVVGFCDIRDGTAQIDIIFPSESKYEQRTSTCRPSRPIGKWGKHISEPESYGRTALTRECTNIRESSKGYRTNTILRAAFKIGQLVAAGYVNEDVAIRDLEMAGSTTGLTRTKVNKTILDGIEAGKKNPRKY